MVKPLHLTGDCLYYPTPPTLGGGLKPTTWLRALASIDEKRGATARAREAREIADWLTRMAKWAANEAYEAAPPPAHVGAHPKGGDSLEAPAPLSDAVPVGDAPAPSTPPTPSQGA